jgi:hypothetical protein
MRYPGFLLPALLLGACTGKFFGESAAQQKAEGELLALHQADRRAHFDHDLNHLLASVGSELLDVRDGKINHLSREDVRNRFAKYFQHAQFTAWDDLEPPIVRVSTDGSMGWMIVRVRITYTEKNSSGKAKVHDETMAWMSAYEKHEGKWTMVAVTSTSAPEGSGR